MNLWCSAELACCKESRFNNEAETPQVEIRNCNDSKQFKPQTASQQDLHYTHVYTHTCMCTQSHTHTHTCTPTHMHACTHAHACMHTRMHTHTHTQRKNSTKAQCRFKIPSYFLKLRFCCRFTHTHTCTHTPVNWNNWQKKVGGSSLLAVVDFKTGKLILSLIQ